MRLRKPLTFLIILNGLVVAFVAGMIWFLSSLGLDIGFVVVMLMTYSGLAGTRIGREITYILLYTVGIGGWNSSGRPGDDHFVGWENFPWLLLSLSLISVVALLLFWLPARKK